jgi:hypothetical protein
MRIETVTYNVNWARFKPGTSFFVPCIDHRSAKTAVNEVMRRLRMKVVVKVVIEDGIKGLRVWRV